MALLVNNNINIFFIRLKMLRFFLIAFNFYNLINLNQCSNNCLDGRAPNTCNKCTNGLCACPGFSRNGYPCKQSSDVNNKLLLSVNKNNLKFHFFASVNAVVTLVYHQTIVKIVMESMALALLHLTQMQIHVRVIFM